MQMKFVSAVLALVLGAGFTSVALAQAKPQVLVKQREAAMVLQGKYFYGQLRPMAQGKQPYDAKVAAQAATFLEALAQMPWDGFQPSTRDEPSRAMDTVYTDAAKFKAAADRYQEQAKKLAATIRSGDEAAAKEQILALDKSCSGCHRDFRTKQ